jgi:hypothetical protein
MDWPYGQGDLAASRYGADAKQGDKQQSHYPRLLVFFGG